MAAAKTPEPLFALRGSKTTAIVSKSQPFPNRAVHDFASQSRVLAFSPDGSLFAFSNGSGVKVYETANEENFQLLLEIDRPRTTAIQFSPCSTILAVWEPCQGTQTPPEPNLQLWNCRTKTCLCELLQKKQTDWCPQWSGDEKICARNVNNEVLFYESNNFSVVSHKLHLQKIANFKLAARNSPPYHVAVLVPGAKGQPSYVRLYQYPNFGDGAVIATKSFFKAEKAELIWNKQGTALIILTSTEASDSSYYGEQGLHYIDTKGESCQVPRAKEGPIYSVAWHPDSKTFCVVYGYMPAKATLYNLKCDPIFDFGTGPRNCVYFNPHGNMLCLAGFGNLRGNMEFWDVSGQRKVSNPQAIDSTYFEWCPDGEHYITATTTPRLRVGNCYKLWHYMKLEPINEWPAEGELYEVLWRPALSGVYPQPTISAASATASAAKAPPKPAAYVPPALRNQPQPAAAANKPKYREEYELPSNMKQAEQKPMSKSALKNKKRKEAKAKKKAEGGDQKDGNEKDSDDDN